MAFLLFYHRSRLLYGPGFSALRELLHRFQYLVLPFEPLFYFGAQFLV